MKKILTLIYLQKNNHTLFLLRGQKSATEISVGKYLGVGGHVDDTDSSIEEGAKREVLEETNLICKNLVKKGVVNFIGQKPYIQETHIFICSEFEGDLQSDNREGTLHWIPNEQILSLSLWEGDKIFLPKLFQPEQFELDLFYDENKKVIQVVEKT